jgi:hypothetical protein
MKVICDTEEDANKLCGAIDWEQVMGAKIAANMYGVVVHGVAKNDTNLEDSKSMVKVVKELGMVNSVNIVHAAPLLQKPQNPGAPTYSIIVYTDNTNHADKLILHGIHIGNRHYNAEKYLPRCQLTQCFKCQGFGHRAERCTRPQRCDRCTEQHETKTCNADTTYTKCALCDGPHPA